MWWMAHTPLIVRKLKLDAASWGGLAIGQNPARTKAWNLAVQVPARRQPPAIPPAEPQSFIFACDVRVNCRKFLRWVHRRACYCFTQQTQRFFSFFCFKGSQSKDAKGIWVLSPQNKPIPAGLKVFHSFKVGQIQQNFTFPSRGEKFSCAEVFTKLWGPALRRLSAAGHRQKIQNVPGFPFPSEVS